MLRARVGTLVVVAVVALSAAACGGGSSSGSSDATIKLGVINPFSGALASGGVAVTQGYEVAVDEINASGGLLGKQVEIIRGDASTPEQGISEANRLATSEETDIFIGTYLSAVANTASQTAERYGKLYWETNGLAADLTERGLSNFVRSGPSAEAFGKVSADSVATLVAPSIGKDVQGLKVCLSHEQSIYGESVATVQEKLLGDAGADIVANVAYDPAAPDLGNVILRCQESKPDVWISTGYTSDSNLLLQTAAQQGFQPDATMLVGSGDTSETQKSVPEAELAGVFVTSYTHNDAAEGYAPGISDFLAAYKSKFGGEPTFPQTMAAYTGAKLLFEAVEKADSTDPEAVRKVLPDLEKELGSTAAGFGEKFDDRYQNTLALPAVVQWQSGQTVTVYPEVAAPEGAEILQAK